MLPAVEAMPAKPATEVKPSVAAKPAVEEKGTVKTGEDESEVSRTQRIVEPTYTVVVGDTLWSIAVRTYADGYKWTEIAKANNLSNPDLIHAGNVLKLPKK